MARRVVRQRPHRKPADGAQMKNAAQPPTRHSVASLLRNTHRLYSRGLLRLVRKAGVTTIMQWWVLRQLWTEDGQTQRSLADRIGLFDSAIVAVLNALEAKQLIDRERNPADRRKINIRLTAKGRRLQRQLLPLADQINLVATRGLTEADRSSLWGLLNQINDNLEGYLAPGAKRTR